MKKVLVLVAVAALMLSATAVPVLAVDQTGTIVVTGGTLSVTPKAVTITGVTLDGTDQDNVSGSTTAWDAEDPTGTGFGWHVDVSSTDFTDASKTIAVTGFDIQLLDASIAVVAGNTKPTSSVTTMTNLSGTPIMICSAALDTGMGSYTLTPTFQLDVPAETYAGTYTATLTVTITSGP